MAWDVLGALVIIIVSLELTASPQLTRWTMATGLVALMVFFPHHAHLPALYHTILANTLSITIFRELVLGTTMALLGIMAYDNKAVSSTLLLLTTSGALLSVSAHNWLILFVGLEMVNIGLYGLMGHFSHSRVADEALLKFFVLGSVFTVAEVMGVGLIASAHNTLTFTASPSHSPLLALGESLILSVLLFKLGSFPFHIWAPDTYEGTSWPAVTTMATLSKIVAASLIIRLTAIGQFHAITHLPVVFYTVALGTMIVGAFGAWQQKTLKRMLAYAAISQTGFILLPLGHDQYGAAGAYLVTYALTSLAVFSSAHAICGTHNPIRMELATIRYRGRSHATAIALAISLAAFAGFPFTVGMIGKLLTMESIFQAPPIIWLTTLLITGLSFLYYFRWIYPLFAGGTEHDAHSSSWWIWTTSQLSALSVVLLGIWSFPIQWLTRVLAG